MLDTVRSSRNAPRKLLFCRLGTGSIQDLSKKKHLMSFHECITRKKFDGNFQIPFIDGLYLELYIQRSNSYFASFATLSFIRAAFSSKTHGGSSYNALSGGLAGGAMRSVIYGSQTRIFDFVRQCANKFGEASYFREKKQASVLL